MNETVEAVEKIIECGRPAQHVVINVARLVLMRRDKKLCEIVNASPLINVDGQGIVWGAQWLGVPVPERVTGIDLFNKLVALASEKGYRAYFLGAREHIVKKLSEIFREEYPTLQVVGWRNGYFTKEDEPKIAQEIHSSGAQILFVAISSPKKEFFINEYKETMGVPFIMGVGNSFDVVSGMTLRAPLWVQRAGLEWFFRFLHEPRRLWKRYFISNPIYLWMLVKAFLLGKKRYECD
jgi:N-acetylglucosaminyldiphosphoundecaprenol N-acetyl-beta-D-mannosaminyltransferase